MEPSCSAAAAAAAPFFSDDAMVVLCSSNLQAATYMNVDTLSFTVHV